MGDLLLFSCLGFLKSIFFIKNFLRFFIYIYRKKSYIIEKISYIIEKKSYIIEKK